MGREMTGDPCVISLAEHAGWAHVLCVAAAGGVPAVVDRRRVPLIDPGLPTQPYHHESLAMTEDDANALIARVRQSVEACATRAVRAIVDDLSPRHVVIAVAIREPAYPSLPDTIADVRRSYSLQCAADGLMYQLALCLAARDLGLQLHQYSRRESLADVAARLGVTHAELESFVTNTGRPSGPPWTQEHRRAYGAAIDALAALKGRLYVRQHGARTQHS